MPETHTPDLILHLIADTLRRDIAPGLDGTARFDVLVCINAVELVARELRLAPAARSAEQASLRQLLGQDGEGGALNAELCARIRDRRIDAATPGLLAHLRARTLARMDIDQPGYAAHRQAHQRWQDAANEGI